MSNRAPIKTQAAVRVAPMPPNYVFEIVNVDFYAFLTPQLRQLVLDEVCDSRLTTTTSNSDY